MTSALTVSCPSSLSLYDFGSFSEKTWFTDEPENTHLRTIQIKPVNTLAINQVSQYKSTSSLIPPIREAEDECWAPDPHRHPKAWTPRRARCVGVRLGLGVSPHLQSANHQYTLEEMTRTAFFPTHSPRQQASCTSSFTVDSYNPRQSHAPSHSNISLHS